MEETKDFDRYLIAAIRLYESLEYEHALAQLGRARKLASTVQEDVIVSLYEGILHADMGRGEEARASFKTALLLDPNAKLPLSVSPKVEKEFETMRTRVKKELAGQQAQSQVTGTMVSPKPDPAEPSAPSMSPSSTLATDRPEQSPPGPGTLVPSATPSAPLISTASDAKLRLPTVPLALAGASLLAGGLGTYFGLHSRSQLAAARQSFYEDEAAARISQAQGSARTANLLLGTAGVAAAGALVTWFLLSGEAAPRAAPPAGPPPAAQ
jgi:hypothetical protein